MGTRRWEFSEFDLGKVKLIELQNPQLKNQEIDQGMLQMVINQNGQKKEAYSTLLQKIESSFKKQIRGDINYKL